MASEAKRAGPQGPPGPPPHPPPSSSTSVKSDQRDPPPAREPKNNKIFVGGISWTTTDEAFSRFFTKYGDIIDAIIMRDKMTRQSRGFGFVTFKDPNTVTSVLEETLELDGRNLDCKLAVPKDEMQQSISSSSQKTRKIFVGGLPPDVTEDDFKKYFEYYGNVVEAKIMTDGMTGKPRGFGFITFDSEEVVDKISEKHHVEINGKTVECKKAIPKGRMDNDRGGHSYGQYNSYGRSSHGGGYGYGGRGGGYGYGGGYGDGGYGDGGYGDGGYGHHENGRGGPRNDYTSSYTSAYHDRGQQGQYGGYSGNYSGYGGNYQGYGSQRSGGYQGDYGGSNGYGGGYGRNSGGYGRGGGGGGGGGGRYDRSYHPYS